MDTYDRSECLQADSAGTSTTTSSAGQLAKVEEDAEDAAATQKLRESKTLSQSRLWTAVCRHFSATGSPAPPPRPEAQAPLSAALPTGVLGDGSSQGEPACDQRLGGEGSQPQPVLSLTPPSSAASAGSGTGKRVRFAPGPFDQRWPATSGHPPHECKAAQPTRNTSASLPRSLSKKDVLETERLVGDIADASVGRLKRRVGMMPLRQAATHPPYQPGPSSAQPAALPPPPAFLRLPPPSHPLFDIPPSLGLAAAPPPPSAVDTTMTDVAVEPPEPVAAAAAQASTSHA